MTPKRAKWVVRIGFYLSAVPLGPAMIAMIPSIMGLAGYREPGIDEMKVKLLEVFYIGIAIYPIIFLISYLTARIGFRRESFRVAIWASYFPTIFICFPLLAGYFAGHMPK